VVGGVDFSPRRALVRLLCVSAAIVLARGELFRFDDNLKTAVVTAAATPSASRLAEPMLWNSFDRNTPWQSVRGRLGFRNGDLVLEGQGGSPVILSPKDLNIDWSRYESVQIRMQAESGSLVQIRIGDYELKQKLLPGPNFHVYRFDLHLEMPTYGRPLAIMPTDSADRPAVIDFIELAPRQIRFPAAAGRQTIGKRDDYRNVLYTHSPSTIAYTVAVPKAARLKFSLGVMDKNKPVRFRVLAGRTEVFAKTVSDPDAWEEAVVDLSAYAGASPRLTFQTEAAKGVVGLWANPLMTTAAHQRRPNVLLYMIDTLRSDHTSLYGYHRDTTPFLKKLGAAGVVFGDAHAQSSWTKPSVASMMTSLHTFAHGIERDIDTIPKGATTLSDQLRGAGYVSASLIANPFAGRTTGLERGFDYLLEYPVVQRQRTDAADRGTDSAAMNRVIFPWLEQHRDEPFFLYMHSTDPHAPYRPPAGFEEQFASAAETAAFDRDYAKLRGARQYGGAAVVSRADLAAAGVNADRWVRQAIDRYDAEIRHNDHAIEALVGKLRQIGVLDNTVVIVVSDHGEEFLDHGWTAHGHSLYQELTSVVFLLWNPKLLPSARRIAEPVQLIDLAPTLLDLLGIKPAGITQGQSLVPLIQGRTFTRKVPVMMSRFAHPTAKSTGFVPENRTGTVARLDGTWKLIYRDQPELAGLSPVELYDRREGWSDATNVVGQQSQMAAKHLAEVKQWIEAQKQVRALLGPAGKTRMDPQTIERLRSLGYIGGAAPR